MSELETGSVSLEDVEVVRPTGREKYDWVEIAKAIKSGQAYVLPDFAKKNSIISGLKNHEIDAVVGTVKDTDRLVVVPT